MKIVAAQIALLLSMSALAMLLTWKFHPLAPALYITSEPLDKGEVSVEKALKLQSEGGVIWIDARPREAYEAGHVPGAVLLNEFEWNDLLFECWDQIANKDESLVIYCGTFSCKASKKIAEKLQELRFSDVYVLKGGWDAWLQQGGESVK